MTRSRRAVLGSLALGCLPFAGCLDSTPADGADGDDPDAGATVSDGGDGGDERDPELADVLGGDDEDSRAPWL